MYIILLHLKHLSNLQNYATATLFINHMIDQKGSALLAESTLCLPTRVTSPCLDSIWSGTLQEPLCTESDRSCSRTLQTSPCTKSDLSRTVVVLSDVSCTEIVLPNLSVRTSVSSPVSSSSLKSWEKNMLNCFTGCYLSYIIHIKVLGNFVAV